LSAQTPRSPSLDVPDDQDTGAGSHDTNRLACDRPNLPMGAGERATGAAGCYSGARGVIRTRERRREGPMRGAAEGPPRPLVIRHGPAQAPSPPAVPTSSVLSSSSNSVASISPAGRRPSRIRRLPERTSARRGGHPGRDVLDHVPWPVLDPSPQQVEDRRDDRQQHQGDEPGHDSTGGEIPATEHVHDGVDPQGQQGDGHEEDEQCPTGDSDVIHRRGSVPRPGLRGWAGRSGPCRRRAHSSGSGGGYARPTMPLLAGPLVTSETVCRFLLLPTTLRAP